MKNKLLMIMLIILVSITLIGVIAVVVFNQLASDGEEGEEEAVELSVEEIAEATVSIPEVTTNINGDNFARVTVSIQTDSKEAAEELTQLEFMVKDILIGELSEMSKADLEGSAGKDAFKEIIKNRVNEFMHEGEVLQVYTTDIVVQ
ncbi:flagellar basal body-associated protein FliL [Jeotgalibacillus aurantiacus]|uniref:flagellar basal body-associated protein FliL n=1 Tax=Jeotgalibacillus aurantiacus TaxID=2763266 RepID=UPI001D0B24B4|nr:flagellar basal body-associated protein FliL [Jeotgalibacillus aurantiacus]